MNNYLHPDLLEDIWDQVDILNHRTGVHICKDSGSGSGSSKATKRALLIKAVEKWKKYRYQEFGLNKIDESHVCKSDICGPLAKDSIVLIDENLKLYGCVISGKYHACDGMSSRNGWKNVCKYTTLNYDGTVTCSFSGRMVDVFIDPSRFKITDRMPSDCGDEECEDDLLVDDLNYDGGEEEEGQQEENPMMTSTNSGILGGGVGAYSCQKRGIMGGTKGRYNGKEPTSRGGGGGDNKNRHREKRRKFYTIQNNVTDAFEQLKFEEYEDVATK